MYNKKASNTHRADISEKFAIDIKSKTFIA